MKVLYNDYWEELPGGSSFSQALPGVSSINFSRVNAQAAYWSALFNHGNNGVGGLGTGISRLGGSFRMTKGLDISFKHYASGWGGGSRASIQTYNAVKWGGKLARGTVGVTAIAGVYNIGQGYIDDNNSFGYHSQLAAAQTVGSLTGGWALAKVGAGIGFGFFGPLGAVVGGAIGGIAGSYGGSKLGEVFINSR